MPKTALLVIDVQSGLFNKGNPVHDSAAFLERLAVLIRQARAAGAPVIYIQHNSKLLPTGSADWALHPGLFPPEAGEPRVQKTHGNSFEETNLKALLDDQGVTHLVITGMVTHGCVKATALGGLELGYAVTLVSDGHSNYHAKPLKMIEETNALLQKAGAELVAARSVLF